MKYAITGLSLLFALSGAPDVAAQTDRADGFRPLIEGDTLEGWRKTGGTSSFDVADGTIIGEAEDTKDNTFLVTEERYGDFIFEAEVKTEGQLNSGIMFRSDARPEYVGGRAHGYQIEVDPSDRRWSGGIYEERLRGWLYPLTRNKACQRAYKADDWNKYRVEAYGTRIQTFLNDVPCARLVDQFGREEGFIGLQVHSVSPSGRSETLGKKVRFRDIRIKTDGVQEAMTSFPDDVVEIAYLQNDLTDWEKKQGFTLLFDGTSSDGWRGAKLDSFPDQGWSIADGLLIVEGADGAEARNGGDIITEREYSDFVFEADFMMTEGSNSGFKYFVDPDLLKGQGSAIGLEFQILDDNRHPDAKMGVAGNRTLGSLYDLIAAGNLSEPSREGKRANPPGRWNRARIVVEGDRVEHWLNNVKVVEYDRGSQMFDALVKYSKYAKWDNFGRWENGPILLQDHGDRVMFRTIKIRELSDTD